MKLGVLASQEFQVAFQKLMSGKGIPVKTSFMLRGLSKKLMSEVKNHSDMKNGLIVELSLKDDKGNIVESVDGEKRTIQFAADKFGEFAKKIKELDDIDVEIPNVSVSDLGGMESLERVGLSPNDILVLEFLSE